MVNTLVIDWFSYRSVENRVIFQRLKSQVPNLTINILGLNEDTPHVNVGERSQALDIPRFLYLFGVKSLCFGYQKQTIFLGRDSLKGFGLFKVSFQRRQSISDN